MSFLFEKLTRAECEAVREADGYEVGFERGEASGFKKGESSGMARGRFNEKCEIATNLIAKGLDMDFISEATGLSEKELESLTCSK